MYLLCCRMNGRDKHECFVCVITASLPPQIGSLQRLETLVLEQNRITSLPPTVEGLKSLRHISLASNDLRAFPVQLCAIRTLDVIDLSHNKLTDVPDAIRDLNAIELNVNQNQVILYFGLPDDT